MQTVSIISQKGGAGKTTLAIHLAVAAQKYRGDTVLLDADPQATASEWAAWRAEAGLDDPAVIDCASPTLLPRKLKGAAELGAAIAIVDTPPHADIMAREAARAADLVLIPCRPQAFDLSAIRITAELVRASGKRAFVVFVAGPTNARLAYQAARDAIESVAGIPVAPLMVPTRAVFTHSAAEGKTALETDPDSKGAWEIKRLWEWIELELASVGGEAEK